MRSFLTQGLMTVLGVLVGTILFHLACDNPVRHGLAPDTTMRIIDVRNGRAYQATYDSTIVIDTVQHTITFKNVRLDQPLK